MSEQTRTRKLEHIEIVLKKEVEPQRTTLLEQVYLEHNSSPDLSIDDIDLSSMFLGKRIAAPVMIAGMTGGHPDTTKINGALAEIAEELNIAIGVGSQRAALEDQSLEYTFSIVREKAPSIPVVANIGGAQLVKGYGIKEAMRAVSMIKADAIAIHLNPAQEVFQPEGDKNFKGLVKIVEELVDNLEVPVIIKETGTGLSGSVARTFAEVGVEYFDISGLGGTSWVMVEKYRSKDATLSNIADLYSSWGIPTALSIIDLVYNVPSIHIIASGGIRNGLEAAKALALGAEVVAFAAPVLRRLLNESKESAKNYIKKVIEELKTALFLTGSNKPLKLWSCNLHFGGEIIYWMYSKGIDINEYNNIRKLRLSLINRF